MAEQQSILRSVIKRVSNAVAIVLVLPFALTCWAAGRLRPQSEVVFLMWGQMFSLVPGLPGMYLRRAFYWMVLDAGSLDCFIGFGSFFTHRQVRVEQGVYIGRYALIGSTWLRRGCLIGSRASLLSGARLHELDEQGHWTPFHFSRLQQIEIGEHAWIGEGAIVMVNIGAGAMVAVGSVVTSAVPASVMVGGNPARFVRRLSLPAQAEPGSDSPAANEHAASDAEAIEGRPTISKHMGAETTAPARAAAAHPAQRAQEMQP